MLAYDAGFFDGEGSVGIYRNGDGVWHLRTQLTQNINTASTKVMERMIATYGGNLAIMRAAIYRGGKAFNWQLNGSAAAAFLRKLHPMLVIKREQAEVAAAWYELSQKPSRSSNGRMLPHEKDRPIDVGAAALLKALKRADIEDVMRAQESLVEIVHTLRQVVCVKG